MAPASLICLSALTFHLVSFWYNRKTARIQAEVIDNYHAIVLHRADEAIRLREAASTERSRADRLQERLDQLEREHLLMRLERDLDALPAKTSVALPEIGERLLEV